MGGQDPVVGFLNDFIVTNEVSDLIFKTIHFHYCTQGESFIIMEVGVVVMGSG